MQKSKDTVNPPMSTACIFWFTGLSGAGKSTIAEAVKSRLELNGLKVFILDGDIIRSQLHKNLGFSKSDIEENNRLISELCVQYQTKYDIILVPVISPFNKSRNAARKKIGKNFFEISLHAGLDTLQKRDTKGLYKKAKEGRMNNLIGVSKKSKYERPKNPDLRINTDCCTEKESVNVLYKFALNKHFSCAPKLNERNVG